MTLETMEKYLRSAWPHCQTYPPASNPQRCQLRSFEKLHEHLAHGIRTTTSSGSLDRLANETTERGLFATLKVGHCRRKRLERFQCRRT